MRVLIVVQNYPPERGPVRYTYDLARWLAERGDDVTVLTGLPHYPTGKPYSGFGRFRTVTTVEDGVRVVRLPMVMASNPQPVRRILGFITFMMHALVRATFCIRPDLVICSVPPATVSIVGYWIRLVRRVPSVVILRDLEPLTSFQLRGMHGCVARFVTRLFMVMYRGATGIVVVHDRQAAILKQFGIEVARITTIPHSIELDRFTPQADAIPVLKVHRCDGRALMMYLGTVGACHDLETFLSMLADERTRNLPIDLVIVGDGEELPGCMQIATRLDLEQVRFVPPVPIEAVPSIARQADLLLSSYVDNPSTLIGSKILEYCAAAKPVLLHGPKQCRDHLEGIGNGWTCANGDTDGLRAALVEILESRSRWPELGRMGHKFATVQFDAHKGQVQWQKLLNNLVGKQDSDQD